VIEGKRDMRLPTIQVLRGIAASLVAFYHFSGNFTMHSWLIESGFSRIGAAGVDIFFVISGFIMVYTTRRKTGARDALTFIKRRALRIYPLYWFWTTVLLALWGIGVLLQMYHGLSLKKYQFSAFFIFSSFVLLPSYDGVAFRPLLAQGWTLSFEMFFYAAFSCAILMRLKKAKLVFLAAAFVVLSLCGRCLGAQNGLRHLFTDPIVLEFLYGVLAAEVLLRVPERRNRKIAQTLPLVLIGLGVVGLLSTAWTNPPLSLRYLFYGLPALLIVSGAAMFGSAPRPRFLVYIGDASYSIYLTHTFAATAFFLALGRIAILGRIPPDAVILAGGLMAIAGCSLTYLLVERPITKFVSPKKAGFVDQTYRDQSPVPVDFHRFPTEDRISSYSKETKKYE
jgi:peptidoglycan/LPS O-acetylase OafA/YrhL